MNTTNILLATTSILVVVAFLLSFGKFSENSDSNEALKERLILEQELTALQAERNALQTPVYRPSYPYPAPAQPNIPAPPAVKEVSDETSADIERIKEQLAEVTEEKDKIERKNEVLEKETTFIHERETKETQRAERAENRIRIALVMGKVNFVNTELGFITFQSQNGMAFLKGDELGIRRGSGVLGRVAILSQDTGQYSAELKPNAYAGGLPPVEIGDELIRLPDNYQSTTLEGQ